MAVQSKKLNIKPVIDKILKVLSDRNSTMLAARYGIANRDNASPTKRETLESIGDRYDITRERVRQIEEASYTKIRNSEHFGLLKPASTEVAAFIDAYGGVVYERALMSNLVTPAQRPHLALLLALADNFVKIKDSDDFEASWATNKKVADYACSLLGDCAKTLHKQARPVSEEELLKMVRSANTVLPNLANDANIYTLLAVSKQIKKGPLGHWGISSWSEINPRGVRDKAYLIYTRENRPLHFRELTQLIDKAKFPSKRSKKTHPQTVHNELIKDNRFVLVGRGTYALVKWGYKPGTVKDVMASILADAGSPLTKEELIQKVLDQRMVQHNTIFLNLQNRKYFRKNSEGKFYLA